MDRHSCCSGTASCTTYNWRQVPIDSVGFSPLALQETRFDEVARGGKPGAGGSENMTFNASLTDLRFFPFLGNCFSSSTFVAGRCLLNIDLNVRILSTRWQYDVSLDRHLWRKSSTRLLLAQSCQQPLVTMKLKQEFHQPPSSVTAGVELASASNGSQKGTSLSSRWVTLNQRLWHVFLQICFWQASDETKRILRLNYHRSHCAAALFHFILFQHFVSVKSFLSSTKILDFWTLTGWLVNLLCISSIDQSEVLS